MIFSKRKKQVRQENEVKRCNQIRETHKKLHKRKPNGVRDTKWWRRAAYSEIWESETLINGETEIFNGIDLLFSSTEA